jgi:hypothetical protein
MEKIVRTNSKVDAGTACMDSANKDVTNHSWNVANDSWDVTNRSRDVANDLRDVTNRSRDVANDLRDVTNRSRDVARHAGNSLFGQGSIHIPTKFRFADSTSKCDKNQNKDA